ncbi:MAG TPA: hypothetical protein VF103_16275, partial [Polyangiaceae bacterium]
MVERALSELADLVSPERAAAYERWLGEQTDAGAYLYTDARVRFEVRDDDVVVAAPGITTRDSNEGTRLTLPSVEQTIDVPGVSPELVERFLGALDGERALADARALAGLSSEDGSEILRATFGLVVFAPFAVLELERAVPSAEIVRFPGSPYEISRNYWRNMASVRARVPRLLECASDPPTALEELRSLHAVTLLGEDERTFYRPASPIAKKGIFPSRLWLAASRTVETDHGTRFVEGPRVGARFLGGDRYGALVAELAGDPRATNDRLEHRDERNLEWGRVVVASADGDEEAAPWFCPPRPLALAHVESLFRSLSDALASLGGRSENAIPHLADFHQKFMRLHPFRAANQPLAMNVVNAVLVELGDRSSRTGIPHLILDHLSFRLKPEAYRKVFALAVEGWTGLGAP